MFSHYDLRYFIEGDMGACLSEECVEGWDEAGWIREQEMEDEAMGRHLHYGPCKVFAACKCKPARKQVSLQTGCRTGDQFGHPFVSGS